MIFSAIRSFVFSICRFCVVNRALFCCFSLFFNWLFSFFFFGFIILSLYLPSLIHSSERKAEAEWVGLHKYGKAFTRRFVLRITNLANSLSSRRQGNGGCPRGYVYTRSLLCPCAQRGCCVTYPAWASALLVQT